MSFKGIAWAGNVYEKFEAMCLEVEEAMYQDTVKYMENQVQKVGVSVKKFYSEVMDDLRPLSCVDPTSIPSDDLSLIPHTFNDVNKKPIPNTSLKKENEDQVMFNVTAEKGLSPSGYDANLFSPQSPGIFVENKSYEKCAASKKIGVHRRPIGIKRISRNNHPSKETSRTTSVSEDRINKVADCERTSSRLASDNTDVTSSSDLNGLSEPGEAAKGKATILDNLIESPVSDKMSSSESVRQDTSKMACVDKNGTSSSGKLVCESGATVKGNTPFCDNQMDSPASENVSSAEPVRQTKEVADCISPAFHKNLPDESVRLKGDPESISSCSVPPTEYTGATVIDIPLSDSGSSMRSEVCNLEYEKGVSVPEGGASSKYGSSSASSTPGNSEACSQNLITSRGTVGMGFEMEFVENEVVAEPQLDNLEASGIVKLEESCVLVEGDELHHALQGTRKHKSYKKRIREALSSKMKAKKDNQFASQGKGGDKKQETSGRVSGVEPEKQEVSAHDSVESDWELV